MIELTKEDLRFKQSAAELMSENLTLIAVALETIEDVKTKYAQDVVYQKSMIGSLKSILGEKNHSTEARELSWWEKPEKTQYGPKLTNMISEYISNRIAEFDREKKSNQEVAEWLREIAK